MKKLLEYKPKIYKNSKIIDNIYKAQQEQLEKTENSRNKLKKNVSVFRAEDIEKWLKEYGIKNTENIAHDRAEVISKVLGNEICDKKLLINLVSKFTNGSVDVEENADDFLISILIISENEKLKNENELTKILYRILPAHIDFKTAYKRPLKGDMSVCGAAQTTEVIRIK